MQPHHLRQLSGWLSWDDVSVTMNTQTITKYYYAGSQRVAMRTGSSTLNFILGDHLGSTSLTTSSTGAYQSETLYKPWGEVRYTSGTLPTKYTFTGQYSNVSDFGLMYYGARWYDVSLGRFASADTLIPEPGNPQSWDRYAYVNNSPLMYTDPSGHCVKEDFDCWDLVGQLEKDFGIIVERPYDKQWSVWTLGRLYGALSKYNNFEYNNTKPLNQADRMTKKVSISERGEGIYGEYVADYDLMEGKIIFDPDAFNSLSQFAHTARHELGHGILNSSGAEGADVIMRHSYSFNEQTDWNIGDPNPKTGPTEYARYASSMEEDAVETLMVTVFPEYLLPGYSLDAGRQSWLNYLFTYFIPAYK